MNTMKRFMLFAVASLVAGTTMANTDGDTVVCNDNSENIVMEAATADSAAPEKPKGQWTTLSKPAVKLSEFFFENWSKSGNSLIDLTSTFFGNYKYTHPKYVWDNIADLAYGYAWQDLDNSKEGGLFETRRKSNDKIDLTSALSWKAYKDWG
ncbi:MAG: DUF3078 domain-containing protein, partial [Bacteroidales bacterium]|nr:DUF3078 domain-containing protein [Bacteroidales bacterium]